jgi:hypothetical protein
VLAVRVPALQAAGYADALSVDLPVRGRVSLLDTCEHNEVRDSSLGLDSSCHRLALLLCSSGKKVWSEWLGRVVWHPRSIRRGPDYPTPAGLLSSRPWLVECGGQGGGDRRGRWWAAGDS